MTCDGPVLESNQLAGRGGGLAAKSVDRLVKIVHGCF